MSDRKWHVDLDPRIDGAHQVCDERGLTVCFVATGYSRDEQEEIANQLAAAPDLLDACESIKRDILPEFLEDHPGSYQAIGLLDAAIAKAKGDQ